MLRRAAAVLLLAGAGLVTAPGCSLVLVETVPVKPKSALRLGAPREALGEVLGSPSSTDAVPPREFVTEYDPDGAFVLRDVYVTSGLVRVGRDEHASIGMEHGMSVIGTFGLLEFYWFPRVTYDLIALSFEDWELYAWYDAAGRLVAWGRRRTDGLGDDAR